MEWTKVWLQDPKAHDFPAAADYLGLLLAPGEVERIVDALRAAPTEAKKAKDILRASALPLLPADNLHVKHNIQKVTSGKKLSPVLLLRGTPMVIADGYHRVCAAYHLTED
ncbi:hypothetical protein [Streptomyces violascens]|uniref:ParB/Sulfiredoxin domain-containing protein n=1 Tax=Streptomyces violascens TaxID=67381 RepID=A0ABQ3QS98_9ACTN|nr:hypothetical protein [Streptomyces violascens]GGU48080.1 hypothetical protein GCM10010289_80810 [Streptomyces violascens]GHI40138.1 hypothetical protein Sviol_45460 [Streptomyces violascens]